MSPSNNNDIQLQQPQHQPLRPPNSSRPLLARRTTALQQAPLNHPVVSSSWLCGLVAGILQAGLFNPYDRALFLSVKHQRFFLHKDNWINGYSGVMQNLSSRAVAGGLYFPMEHYWLQRLDRTDHWSYFVAGSLAGCVNSLLIHPLTAIRYKTFARTTPRTFVDELLHMYSQSNQSIRPFFRGMPSTLVRDVVFGGTYTYLRLSQDEISHASNLAAAAVATLLSGPFNYTRNVQLGTRSHKSAETMLAILRQLLMQVKSLPTLLEQWSLIQNRLRIGWGTVRVAFGMTFGHAVYDSLQTLIQNHRLKHFVS